MQVYILKESNSDSRVAAYPEAVKKMTEWGRNVVIQDDAGLDSNFSNDDNANRGEKIARELAEIGTSKLIVKIKKR